ncbi:hypothetical protein CSA08_04465 [Candidatus Gracilibacteria bacterium]|nr:MAG: hypothetical protein CSA08_04465 [Candidatus Gracilibacteria bacterium]
MKNIIKLINIIIFLLFTFFMLIPYGNAEGIEDIEYTKNLNINEELIIDLSKIHSELEEKYQATITFEWDIRGASTRSGNIFKRKFTSIGEKNISLNLYKEENGEKKLILNTNISLFIFDKSLPVIFDKDINKTDIINFIKNGKESGVYIYNLGEISESNISTKNILNKLKKYQTITGDESDYVLIWGEKDFLLSIVSKLNKEILSSGYNKKINLVLMSSFNINVLKNYLNNFLSDKKWINRIILTDDSSRFNIIKVPSKISELSLMLKNNKYSYLELNIISKIDNFLFISKFINNLSNKGFNAKNIYLIIIIPFLLFFLGFTKHFLGFSPIGIMVPISLTLLIFKIGLLISIIMLLVLLVINMIIGKLTNKYTLLYTPKISLIITINIIVFFIALNILYKYNMIDTSLNDTIFIIFFIIISERLITIILGKDFSEYKYNLLNTIIFSSITYLFLNIDIIKIFILAYPETLLALIPLNFIIGKFTGLRVTEYLRFKEVIKNIEE